MAGPEEYCLYCGGQIHMMVQKGSGFCSQNCQDVYEPPDSSSLDELRVDDVPVFPERDTD